MSMILRLFLRRLNRRLDALESRLLNVAADMHRIRRERKQ